MRINYDFIMTLISNASLLLLLCVIFTFTPIQFPNKNTKKNVLSGFIIGIVAIALMSFPFSMNNGIIFDTRTILYSITGMFFGLIPTMISAIIGIVYRIILGGSGLYMGIFTIFSASLIGLIWNNYRYKNLPKSKVQKTIEFYIVSFIVHVIMLIGTLLLPSTTIKDTLSSLALPVLALYPLVSLVLCILLMQQNEQQLIKSKLAENERKLHSILMSVGNCIIAADKDLSITVFNNQFIDFSGFSREKIKNMNMHQVFSTDKPLTRYIEKVIKEKKIVRLSTEIEFSNNKTKKHYIKGNLSPILDENKKILGILLVFQDATNEKKYQDRLNYISYHDSLTNLYNRRYFEEKLNTSLLAKQLPVSIIIGDLNGLKLTNDSFGHLIGDELLKAAAKRIEIALENENCIISRWGGDEFAILLLNTSMPKAKTLTNKIKNECSKIQIKDINFSISLGYDTLNDITQNLTDILTKAEDKMYDKKLNESKEFKENFVLNLIKALHKKYPIEKTHSEETEKLCYKIGKSLNMNERELDELRNLGYLHNIGKISLSDETFDKILTNKYIDNKTWNEIKKIPIVSYKILNSSNKYSNIAKYVLCHHERPDGKGYPNNLSNNNIPLQSKILMVAEAYSAMKSPRAYKEKLSKAESFKELLKNSGTQFDPSIVDNFIKSLQ